MTTTPALYGRFGYTLAFAERTLTAQLRQHLAERDVKPESWYALRLIAAEGPGLAREALSHELESSSQRAEWTRTTNRPAQDAGTNCAKADCWPRVVGMRCACPPTLARGVGARARARTWWRLPGSRCPAQTGSG